MNIDEIQRLRSWTGRTEQRTDFVTSASLAAMSAMLDRDEPEPQPGSDAAPLTHWLLFHPLARQSEVAADGHAGVGSFLPPVPLRRRMWAGGRLTFHHPLRVGDEVLRTSRIVDVTAESAPGGAIVFVTIEHELTNALGLAIVEQEDLVYMDSASGHASLQAGSRLEKPPDFCKEIVPDPTLLFRYSALTFDGHRIHYDRDYSVKVEGYPGLVVHGPLVATLLVDAWRSYRPETSLQRVEFIAMRPLFDTHAFKVCGRTDGRHSLHLWAEDHEGFLSVRAEAQFGQNLPRAPDTFS